MPNDIDSIILCGSQIELSEDKSDPDIYRARFLISGFGVNANNVQLDREHIEEWLNTLVDKPVVGKVSLSSTGELDFESHNLRVITKYKDGKAYKEAEFDTTPFGHFTSASIETADDGNEYIYADAVLYKRYKNAIGVLERRMANNETISTSWEIISEESSPKIENGNIVKLITKGRFQAHCFLGSKIMPAYSESGLLSVASKQEEELDFALSQDYMDSISESSNINIENKEVIEMEDNMENVEQTVATSETEEVSEQQTDNVVVETSTETVEDNDISEVHTENDETEVSALTERDLHRSLNEAFEAPDSNGRCTYGYPVLIFPADNTAWFKEYGAKSELDLIEVKYTVENSQVKITERNPVTLTISPREINQVVAQKDNAIVEMSAQIQTLNDKVAELQPYKTKVDEIEKAEKEAQLENDKKELSNYALSSGHITQEELETSEEIKGYIEALDKASIKSLIADRVVASLANKETQEVHTSESVENNETEANIQVNLSAEKANKKDDSYAFEAIRAYIGR